MQHVTQTHVDLGLSYFENNRWNSFVWQGNCKYVIIPSNKHAFACCHYEHYELSPLKEKWIALSIPGWSFLTDCWGSAFPLALLMSWSEPVHLKTADPPGSPLYEWVPYAGDWAVGMGTIKMQTRWLLRYATWGQAQHFTAAQIFTAQKTSQRLVQTRADIKNTIQYLT